MRVPYRTLLLLAGGIGVLWVVPGSRVAPLGLVLLLRGEPRPLAMPVEGVLPRDIRDTWGAARGGGRRHQGVDIFAPRGRTVLSSTEGVITKVGVDALGGRCVWVLGPRGRLHYYAHLDSWRDLERGQWIPPGTPLGTVGDSGNAKGTPPHLHYGVYSLRGEALNPCPLLNASAPLPGRS